MGEMPEKVYFEFVTGDFGCRIKRWQRSPFDGCQEYTRSDLSDQRIAALEEKLAMAEKALRIVRAIANGDKAEIISQGYDFKSPVKLSDWCMVHIDKALSAISAKDGEK